MRLGLILPTFRSTPADATDAAAAAGAAGLDGVFCYDHLWPMGSPERPAIAPFEVLAAVAARHRGLVVGTLVARVGLVADEVLLSQARALRAVAGDATVIALGTGDSKSKDENLAYGIGFDPPSQRRAELASIAAALRAEGTEVWIGGGAPATREVAVGLGATLNLWDAAPAEVEAAAARGPVSWAGPFPTAGGRADHAAAGRLVAALSAAGATWAVFGAPATVGDVVAARRAT